MNVMRGDGLIRHRTASESTFPMLGKVDSFEDEIRE